MSNRLFCLSARVRSPSGLRHCLASAIRRLVPAAAFLATAPALPAAQELALFDAQDPRAAWTFDNGAEFPGAKGALRVREDVEPQFRPCLELQADFRGGGNYVQMGRPLPEADIEAVSFWLKAPADTRDITLRLVDGTDQCHQFVLGIEPHGRWQRIFFPVAHALEQAGKGAPLPMVRRYEGWGGARDGAWHNPGKGLYILSGRNVTGEAGTGSLLIAGARAVLAPPTTIVTREVRLDEFLQGGELDWGFNDGREFPGAKGGAALAEDVPEPGAYAVRLWGDFSEGGAYVSGEKRLGGLPVRAVRMRVRTENVRQINVRFGDGTGQCHQGRGIALTPDGAWHELVIPVADVVGGEHWGGANDGRWHGNAQYFSLILSAGSAADKKPELLIRDIRAEIETRMAVAGEPWSDGFEAGAAAWQVEGAGTAATELAAPYEGGACLRTARTEDDRNRAFRVLGPVFPAGAGRWNLSGAARPALYSPDNSFAVRLVALALDDAGALLEALPVADVTQGATWRTFAREIRFPAATAKARLAVEWHKTHGTCDFDALRATPVTEAEPDPIVDRIEIFSDVLGNLFYPEQPLTFHFRVRTLRPLPPAARTLRLTATDYWGAECIATRRAALRPDGTDGAFCVYTGSVTLNRDAFPVGRYHELRVRFHADGYAPHDEHSGFARLAEAESRKYDPHRIPFSIRNWDSRIRDYFKIASRIGHRLIGLWGDSGISDVVAQGDLWYSGARSAEVERNGWANITEEELRNDTREFMRKHGRNGMACLTLGNEPNENPAKVAEKVRAYRIAYEAAKEVCPEVPVVATSVPALETFFEAGLHQYCDAFDFHVYESWRNVREGVRRYKEMMRKYGVDKPVWCTELGLNSQGQTRYAVACEMVKKITAFFAEGGANVSWFTILYPDGAGKARGTSGDAHNTFDCQYSRYNPRLDGITYYWMINAVTVKRFVDEARYPGDVHAFLFRDPETGECLQVLWTEGEPVDAALPLPAVRDGVLRIAVDGDCARLPVAPAAAQQPGTLTLRIGEPVLLRYRPVDPAAPVRLPASLAAPALRLTAPPPAILKGGTVRIPLASAVPLRPEQLEVIVPPGWRAALERDGAGGLVCSVAAPAETDAREGRIRIRTRPDAPASAELTLNLPVLGAIGVTLLAEPDGGLCAAFRNNGAEPARIDWVFELLGTCPMREGSYRLQNLRPPETFLRGEREGRATIQPGETHRARVTLDGFHPLSLYSVRVTGTDADGRAVSRTRYAGGFAAAPRMDAAPVIDGAADESCWRRATTQFIDLPEQVFRFRRTTAPWQGPDDLSASWRAAWDEEALYLFVSVTDDVLRTPHADSRIWDQDGLQLLIDSCRTAAEKTGKIDLAVSDTPEGPRAWCYLSAHPSVATGPVAVQVAARSSANRRDVELAIPWKLLAPFQPEPGANLGLALILNEDDGNGRVGFNGWFSGVHSKQLDLVGDLILR